MQTPSAGDWWVVATNGAYLLAAVAAGWFREYPRMGSFVAIAFVSAMYHWCKDTEFHAPTADNGCSKTFSWRINKGDHTLSYWLVGSMLLALIPSARTEQWWWPDPLLLSLSLTGHVLVTVFMFQPINSWEEDVWQLSVAVTIGAIKAAWCLSATELRPRVRALGVYWSALQEERGAKCSRALGGSIVVIGVAACVIMFNSVGDNQTAHGTWHCASATLIVLVLYVKHNGHRPGPAKHQYTGL